MILGRDFIAGTGMQLDISAGGYKLPDDPTMVPFAESLEQTPHTTDVLATTELLPETLTLQVRDFKGTPTQRMQLEALLLQFSGMFTEKPGMTEVLQPSPNEQ